MLEAEWIEYAHLTHFKFWAETSFSLESFIIKMRSQ